MFSQSVRDADDDDDADDADVFLFFSVDHFFLLIICASHVIPRRESHMLPCERVSHGTQGKIKQKLHFHKVHNNNDWLHAGSAKDPASRPQQ